MPAMDTPRSAYRAGELEIDTATGEVSREDGARLRLSPINMAVLASLVEAGGEVVSRAGLFDRVWPNQVVSDDVLTRAISDLRQQLKATFGANTYIETLPKRGYRWTVSVDSIASKPEHDRAAAPAPAGPRRSQAESLAQSLSESLPQSQSPSLFQPRRLAIYLVSALLLASIGVGLLDTMTTPALSRVAVLPVDTAGQADSMAGELDELIAAELLRLDRLEFLSHSAVASRPPQAFPYLHTELGADRVVESRLRASETGRFLLTVSVTDARTAIVSVARSMEVDGDRASLAGGVRRLVSEIRPYLQSTSGP
jgi:DNA-binding winged helix-turn-helix (wHTH) protein